MTAEEVRALPITEKIQIMEALWEDLRDRFERLDLPQAHKDLLDQRRSRVEKGTSRLLDWDAVKSTIGRA
jgi:putative addiction module component (TIGR02574 family)